jgi:hypothetical protein
MLGSQLAVCGMLLALSACFYFAQTTSTELNSEAYDVPGGLGEFVATLSGLYGAGMWTQHVSVCLNALHRLIIVVVAILGRFFPLQ